MISYGAAIFITAVLGALCFMLGAAIGSGKRSDAERWEALVHKVTGENKELREEVRDAQYKADKFAREIDRVSRMTQPDFVQWRLIVSTARSEAERVEKGDSGR